MIAKTKNHNSKRGRLLTDKTKALESLEAIRKKTIDLDEEWRRWWLENHELLDDNDWWKKPALFGVPRLNDPGEWSGQAPSKTELDAAITALEED